MSRESNLPCGVCGVICSHLGARGRIVVCDNCEKRAVDADGRPIIFKETFSHIGAKICFDGPKAFVKEPDPEAGEPSEIANSSGFVYVDGVECELYEGVAGWSGLVVKNARKI